MIGEGLCPFAAPVFDTLLIEVSDSDDLNQVTDDFLRLLERVAQADPQQLPTALLVMPQVLSEFDEYWNWVAICENLLSQLGHEGELQLATFHPQYVFEGEDPDDPSNFSNRSPFPTLHIIREADIESALDNVPYPERIPERNQRHLRRLGCQGILQIMPSLAPSRVVKSN